MKNLKIAATLIVALMSLAPVTVSATDNFTPIISPYTPLEIVDKTTGKIIGELVVDGANAQLIRALAEKAREETQNTDNALLNRKPPLEWSQFWNDVLPINVGP